jgi:predicted nucleotidyltransferase
MDIDISKCARHLKDKEERRIWEKENLRRKVITKLSLLSEVLNDFPKVRKAYIFGSILKKGRFGENSDIDIALEGDVKEDYFPIWGKLEEKLGERVDLRILENNSTSQIIKREGKLVYERGN